MNKVSIIGTGPAGLTAAIYAARAGLKPVIFTGIQHGGQLTTTTDVENFPGFSNGISGPNLMTEMTQQAVRVGAEMVYDSITKVDFAKKIPVLFTSRTSLETLTVIIATGASAKTLGLTGESNLIGRGVSTCATCDGSFYKDKVVMVIGGGDSAMEEALYLSKLCKKVYLVHRRKVFRASNIMLERAKGQDKIEFLTPFVPTTLESDNSGLTGVHIANAENQKNRRLEIDGLFYAIGHTPNSSIFKPFLETDQYGYLKVKNTTETRVPGVFAAGDIADPVFKQAITAAGMGCQAAIQATRYIEALASH